MLIPKELKSHSSDYLPKTWQNYTFSELGWWVHLLTKRAKHRKNPAKIKKDLYDARNYLKIMSAKLDELEKRSTNTLDGRADCNGDISSI